MSSPAPISEEISAVVDSLPVAPRLLAELGPKLARSDVDIAEVSGTLRRDPGMTARIIAAANSAAYGAAEPIASLEDAIGRIGFREAYRIIGAIASTQVAERNLAAYGIPVRRLRENALFVALVMEELAPHAGLEPKAAYTIGLLRSVGKIVLDRVIAAKTDVAPYEPGTIPLGEWELNHAGIANTEVAAWVLEKWRFPSETSAAVRDHYAPTEAADAAAHLLNVAAGAADWRDFGFPGETPYWQFTALNFARANVDEGTLVWAGERAFQTLSRISSALG